MAEKSDTETDRRDEDDDAAEPDAEPAKGADDEDDDRSASDEAADASASEEVEKDRSDEDDDAEERDASTVGVAKSLGIDDDEDAEAEAAKEDEKVTQNRAMRRREEAAKRRAGREKKRAGDATTALATTDDDDVVEAKVPSKSLPKDKNARAKELLKRRQEAAKGSRADIGLSAGELVQDSLARAASGTTKWLTANYKYVLGSVLAAVVVTGSVLYYIHYTDTQKGAASDDLYAGIAADRGRVLAEDKRPDENKKLDPLPVFSSVGVRADTALAAYTKAAEAHDDTGPGILAKLGQAGAYLDKKQWDAAKDGFEVVLKTPLATADVDVKARALEGKGFALEGKGDTEAAIAAFKELEGVDKSFEDLGKYHQARMHQKKGENDKAKELLVGLRKKLEVPTLDGAPQSWLRAAVEEVLREIDPASVPSKRKQLGGGMKGGATSPEEIQRILDQLQKKQQEGETGHDHE